MHQNKNIIQRNDTLEFKQGLYLVILLISETYESLYELTGSFLIDYYNTFDAQMIVIGFVFFKAYLLGTNISFVGYLSND